MMFVPFPKLDAAERVARSAIIDPAAVRVSPAEVVRIAEGAETLRLVSVAGRAAYVVALPAWPLAVFAADNGAPLRPVSAAQAKAVAEAFGGAAAVKVDGPISYDQWIVPQRYDALRPYYRVKLSDPQGVVLYVSARTGEVVQRTRAVERFWNWPGSVVHWLYAAPLRKDVGTWTPIVGSLALAAALTAAVGLLLGVMRAMEGRDRAENEEPVPVWLEYHYILGLIGGVFILTWAVSGWLSVYYGSLAPRSDIGAQAGVLYTGETVAAAAERITLQDLSVLGPSSRIEIGSLGGQAFAAATGGGAKPRIVLAGSAGPPLARLPDTLISRAVRGVLPTEPGPVEPVPANDFYAAALDLPASVVVLRTGGAAQRVYVDSIDGRLLNVLSKRDAGFAWITYGLHGLRFPGLIEQPILRAVLILIPLTLALALSISSVVVAVRRLTFTAKKRKRRRRTFGVKVLQRSLDH